jgi:hypothetical protein
MKIQRAILHTKGLESQFDNEVTLEELSVYTQIFDAMDGQEAVVIQSSGEYHFGGLTDEAKGKELCYLMEQDPFVGCYIDDREGFDAVYDSGDYAPDCAFCLPIDAIEIIATEGGKKE